MLYKRHFSEIARSKLWEDMKQERKTVRTMMKQDELRFARKGFMKNVIISQEDFSKKQVEIVTGIIQEASSKRRQRICNIYGSLENYEAILKELTELKVDVQKGLVEIMMDNLEVRTEVKCKILEKLYGVENVIYEEAEYVDDDDYDDDYVDDDDEYYEDDDDEYYEDDDYVDGDEDDYDDDYVDDDEDDYDDDYVDDDEDDYDDDHVDDDDDDEEYDPEEEVYLECLECYLFEDSEEYEMPAFQERLMELRRIMVKYDEYSEAEETKLCLDMGTVLDMSGTENMEVVKEVPIEFSYEMKNEAIAICKKCETMVPESRTTKAKSKALIEEIVRKAEINPANMALLDELIEKGSEYQLQRLFLNLEK